MAEEQVGVVKKFFARPSVAAIEVTAPIKVGDQIHIKGHTSDFNDTVASIEVDNQPIQEASPGQLIGIKVKERAREHDIVYRVTE